MRRPPNGAMADSVRQALGTELKICPFCASPELEVVSVRELSGDGFRVQCQTCYATGPRFINRATAVKAWNRADRP